jgi:hypothetical protein
MAMRWTWVALVAVVVIFALGFLAIGTAHRDRCLNAGNVGCSLLPWSGHPSGGLQNVVIP